MRNYKKKVKLYTEQSVDAAIREVEGGGSIKKAAKKYHMSCWMLSQRLKSHNGKITLQKQVHFIYIVTLYFTIYFSILTLLIFSQGRKTALGDDVESKLAVCVRQMAELGFGPTFLEMVELVRDYIVANDIRTNFKDDRPGYDWTNAFMKRHNLRLKKGGQMQIARKNVTSDPFVIKGFYEMLKKEVDRLGVADRADCFWNCDESGFPIPCPIAQLLLSLLPQGANAR